MSAAWFVDGEYLSKIWQNLGRADNLDYVKLRQHLEATYLDAALKERIEERTTSTRIPTRRPRERTPITMPWPIRRRVDPGYASSWNG